MTMESTKPDYYRIVGVSPEADTDAIKTSFVERAKLLIEAYQTLIDAEARSQYDNEVKFGTQSSGASPEIQVPSPYAMTADATALAEPDKNLRNLVVSLDGRTMLVGKKITKRLLSRIPVETPVAVHLPDGSIREGKLKDLSGTGARISVRADLIVEGVMEIGISRDVPPFVLAQVVRIITKGQEFGVKWIQVFEKRLPKGMLSDGIL